jgi:leucyl aminopeptidase
VKIRAVAAARSTPATARGATVEQTRRSKGGSTAEPLLGYFATQGFGGELGQCVAVPDDAGGTVLHVGLGPAAGVDDRTLRSAAAVAARAASRVKALTLDLTGGLPAGAVDGAAALRAQAEGAALGAYRWGGYRSTAPVKGLADVQLVDPDGKAAKAAKEAVAAGARVAAAVNFARDLVNEPGGMLTATEFGAQVAIAASAGGVGCTVHDEDAIRALGFGGLLAVNQGSTQPPRFVELSHDPDDADDDTPTVALVGKGVTFDSGGYSIKTADGMTTMKCDMGGGAAVAAVLCACRDLGVPLRVRGYVPLTDNMIGGDAQRVGDVITHYGGSTTEVLNTDAEGRLILADVLAWASERRDDHPQPAAVIDLATLTGACMVALGTRTAGLWANDDELADLVLAAGAEAGERLWRMPLVEAQRKDLDSKVADRKNVAGRYGGAITASLYLRDFVAAGVPWAHLDIAGPAFNEGADELEVPSGGTGYGVRTLLDLLVRWPS